MGSDPSFRGKPSAAILSQKAYPPAQLGKLVEKLGFPDLTKCVMDTPVVGIQLIRDCLQFIFL